MGTVITMLNLPVVLAALGLDQHLWIVRVLILAIGAVLSWRGVMKARANSKAASELEGATATEIVVEPQRA